MKVNSITDQLLLRPHNARVLLKRRVPNQKFHAHKLNLLFIREMFNIECDFTEEELKQVQKENEWCDEK